MRLNIDLWEDFSKRDVLRSSLSEKMLFFCRALEYLNDMQYELAFAY